MPKRNFIHVASLLLLCLFTAPLSAHPHSWVTLKSEFLLDQKGRLTEIRQHWQFDALFSATTVADAIMEYGDPETGLQATAEGMVKRLSDYGYFSELTFGDIEIDLPFPREYQLSAGFVSGQDQLSLQMTFQLNEPRPLDQALAWRVFDPSYYVDMRHDDLNRIIVHNSADTDCAARLDKPNPSQAMIVYASSLDKTESATDGLGSHFAEKVVINCR